jgi:PAS domain-containing protein
MAHSSLGFSDTSQILDEPAPYLTENGMLISEYRHTLGSLLHILLGVLLAMLLVVSYLQRDPHEQLILGGLISLIAFLEVLYLKGYSKHLPSLIVYALIVCTTVGIVTYGSLRSVAILGFAAAIASASIFLSRTGLAVATAVVCAVCGALTYGETHQLLRRTQFEISLSSWLLYCVVFIGFAMSVYQSRRVTVLAVKAQARQVKRAEAAEQQAQASREQLAMVYRNSPGAIAVLDGTTLIYL